MRRIGQRPARIVHAHTVVSVDGVSAGVEHRLRAIGEIGHQRPAVMCVIDLLPVPGDGELPGRSRSDAACWDTFSPVRRTRRWRWNSDRRKSSFPPARTWRLLPAPSRASDRTAVPNFLAALSYSLAANSFSPSAKQLRAIFLFGPRPTACFIDLLKCSGENQSRPSSSFGW